MDIVKTHSVLTESESNTLTMVHGLPATNLRNILSLAQPHTNNESEAGQPLPSITQF